MNQIEPTQEEINESEWTNPANWSGWFSDIYFSNFDSRWWVRRRKQSMGWTINYANLRAMPYYYASQLFLLGIGVLVGFVFGRLTG
jgi:hypothetical protein